MEEPDKILVRSNGTVTYTGKDIAYQLWKFGLLPIDFDYERFEPDWSSGAVAEEEIPAGRPGASGLADGALRRLRRRARVRPRHARRTTSSTCASRIRRRSCGRASASLGHDREADALDPLLLRDRGALADGRARARRAVRRGVPPLGRGREEALRRDVRAQGPRASRPTTSSSCFSSARGPRSTAAARRGGRRRRGRRRCARDRGRGAAVLPAEGRPQQGHRVRLRRGPQLRGRHGPVPPVLAGPRRQHLPQARGEGHRRPTVDPSELSDEGWDDDLWAVALDAASTPDVAERAVESLELATLARHAFGLAQGFNHFYHRQPIPRSPTRPSGTAGSRSRVFSAGRWRRCSSSWGSRSRRRM